MSLDVFNSIAKKLHKVAGGNVKTAEKHCLKFRTDSYSN